MQITRSSERNSKLTFLHYKLIIIIIIIEDFKKSLSVFQRSVAQKSSWAIWPWRWRHYAPAKRRNCLILEEGIVCFSETLVIVAKSRHGNIPGDLNIFQHRHKKDDSMVVLEVAWKLVGISASVQRIGYGMDERRKWTWLKAATGIFFTASKQLSGLPHPMGIEGFITGDSVTEEWIWSLISF